jgi:long-subunit fatty acid transport protein
LVIFVRVHVAALMDNSMCHRTPDLFDYLKYVILPLSLVLFFQTDAVADTASFLGLSSRASSMAGAMTAISNDYTAAYYNPSGLSYALDSGKWLQAGIGAMYIAPDFRITDSLGKEKKDNENVKAITAGLVMDLGRLESHMHGFNLGLSFFMPTQAIIDVDTPESARDYFLPVYNHVARGMVSYAGLSRSFGDKFSVGIGTSILLRLTDTDTHMALRIDANRILDNINDIQKLIDELQIDVSDSAKIKPSANRELMLNMAVHAGLTYNPASWLCIGFSFRDKINSDSSGYEYLYILPVDQNGNVVIELANRLPVIKVGVDHNLFFSPREYTLGIALKGSVITAALDVTYSEWSGYQGPHIETPQPAFKDTLNPRIGVEIAATEKIRLRAGYMYRPTPAPKQTGTYNYLDGDTHIFSSGAGYSFGDSTIDAYFQYHYMPEGEVTKDVTGVSVEYGGSLMNTGITYSMRF